MEWMLMPLKRYADFSGRSRRMEFWMWQVFKILLNLAFSVLMVLVGGGAGLLAAQSRGNFSPAGMAGLGGLVLILYVLQFVVALAFIIPDIAVAVRRLHDTGRTGWWLLAPLVGIVAIVAAVFAGIAGRQVAPLMLLGVCLFLGLGVVLLVFYFLDGTRGPNRYGPDPKHPFDASVFA